MVDSVVTGTDPVTETMLTFMRVLRGSGVPIPGNATSLAVRIASLVDTEDREELFWGLFSGLISDRRHLEVYTLAFDTVFKTGKKPALMPKNQLVPPSGTLAAGLARVLSAVGAPKGPKESADGMVGVAASQEEVLRTKDFEQMSVEELRSAQFLLRQASIIVQPRPVRRLIPSGLGRSVDLRRSLRRSLSSGGELVTLARRDRDRRPPPIVVLCDVSGSMSVYSRMFLHLAHALSMNGRRCHVFVFGTRLTHVSQHLGVRDVDAALGAVARRVEDFDGGTRMTAALSTFNREWAKRVLGQRSILLLLTDGLERGADPGALEKEVLRLVRRAYRTVWVNPLLRYDGYEPLAAGADVLSRAIVERRAAHNVQSLVELAELLR